MQKGWPREKQEPPCPLRDLRIFPPAANLSAIPCPILILINQKNERDKRNPARNPFSLGFLSHTVFYFTRIPGSSYGRNLLLSVHRFGSESIFVVPHQRDRVPTPDQVRYAWPPCTPTVADEGGDSINCSIAPTVLLTRSGVGT